jgi:hypothetical protein
MKIFFMLINLFSLSCSVNANTFSGEYELVKGPKSCPAGELRWQENRLLFGTRHVWILGPSEKGESKEVVEGGCSYQTNYEKNNSKITIKTTRSSCPEKNENAVVLEELKNTNNILTYSFKSEGEKKIITQFECEYKKSVEK